MIEQLLRRLARLERIVEKLLRDVEAERQARVALEQRLRELRGG